MPRVPRRLRAATTSRPRPRDAPALETSIRDRIEALPDGSYEFGLDIDGYDERVHLHATIEIAGSDVHVDYAGTSPAVADRRDQLRLQHHLRLDDVPVQVRARPGDPEQRGAVPADLGVGARGLDPERALPGTR